MIWQVGIDLSAKSREGGGWGLERYLGRVVATFRKEGGELVGQPLEGAREAAEMAEALEERMRDRIRKAGVSMKRGESWESPLEEEGDLEGEGGFAALGGEVWEEHEGSLGSEAEERTLAELAKILEEGCSEMGWGISVVSIERQFPMEGSWRIEAEKLKAKEEKASLDLGVGEGSARRRGIGL